MRRIAAAFAIAALYATCASAASSSGNGRIAYARGNAIYTSELDGSGEVRIASAQEPFFVGNPAWSPDGRRLAFIKQISTSDSVPVVVDADGRNQTQLARTGQHSFACWLDGSRFVVRRSYVAGTDPYVSAEDLYLFDGDARSSRRLTDDGGQKPVHYQGCAPDGSAVAYSRQNDGVSDAYVAGVDGTVKRITIGGADGAPAWSPTGSKLAFVRNGHLFSAKPDGSDAAPLGHQEHAVGSFSWSPDATQIVFTTVYTDYSRCYRGWCATAQEPYLINADGTAERELETKVQGAWSWSPDGTKLAASGPFVLNADGSCPTKLQNSLPTDSVFWQPVPGGSAGAPFHCADLSISASPLGVEAPAGQLVGFTLKVTNNGNESASAVELTSTGDMLVDSADPGQGSCTFEYCSLGAIAPHEEVRVSVLAYAMEGFSSSYWRARAPEPDGTPGDNLVGFTARGFDCTVLGSSSNDVLYGTIGDDIVCARGGGDRIFGRAGRDRLLGSYGPDTISGGPGRDVLNGGSERDVLLARDGYRDTVICGDQYDIAIVDVLDVVKRSCELVYRPVKPRRRGRNR